MLYLFIVNSIILPEHTQNCAFQFIFYEQCEYRIYVINIIILISDVQVHFKFMSTNQGDLGSEQYETVLKFMETTNQQDFSLAVQFLRAHEFNLQRAINSKFGGATDHHHNQNYLGTQQQNQTHRTHEPGQLNPRTQQQIQRYIQYLREKQNKSVFLGIFSFAKSFVVGLVTGITEIILPEFLLQKILRSTFYNQYRNKILPDFRDRKLSYHLKNGYLSRKPIIFVISASGQTHECFINLFNRPQIAKKINQSFIFAGAIQNEKQCQQIQGDKQPPTIVICRQNVFQKVEIIKKYIGQNAIEAIDVDKLNYALRDHQRATRRDRNLLIKYRNYIRRTYYGGRPGFYEEQEQQQQLYHEHHTVSSDMIKKQNEEYKKVQQETRRKMSLEQIQKQKQMEEQKKHEQLQEQRKVRKMSIPEEPTTGQIIRINFRCPDGSTKTRNFESNEKMDLIYHWVQTNEEIQFEDNKKRHFELMHGFPPASLCERREHKLKDIFQSDQEKIMIRQL